jgi:hypothetical protein
MPVPRIPGLQPAIHNAGGAKALGAEGFFAKNVLINGNFIVAQRGTSFTSATTPANSDDTYLFDRWILLSDGNDRADVTQETSVIPTPGYSAIKLDVETVGSPNEKFGILQVIEQKNCAHLIGQRVSLSFKARTTGGVAENLRAGIVEWTGAADTVTSDLVSAWAVEGTNPTLAASWAFLNTPANLALGNTYATFKIEDIAVGASMTNLGVFIWEDDTDLVATDVIYITDVQLERGSHATDFEYRPFQTELALCQRYYEKTFDYGVAPVQNSTDYNGALNGTGSGAIGSGVGTIYIDWEFKVEKHKVGTVTMYNPAAANASARNVTDGTDTALTADPGTRSVYFVSTAADNTDNEDRMAIHASVQAEL